MDSSPSKRRRTSPSSSLAVTVENTDLGLLPPNDASKSRRRSSFLSPTNSSLARFHPSLLSRAKSAEPPWPVSKDIHGPIEHDYVIAGEPSGIAGPVAGTASKELESGTNGVDKGQELRATPRRRSRTPREVSASPKPGLFVTNPGSRASLPEEARDDGAALNGANGNRQEPVIEGTNIKSDGITVVPDSQNAQLLATPTQRGLLVPTSGIGLGEDGEPNLPSTPPRLVLELPRERPKGLLFSSPTRRSRRKVRSSVKSSPMKPLDVPQEHPNQKQKSLVASLGPRCYIANTPKPPPLPEEAHLLQIQNRLDNLEKQLQDAEDKVLRQLLVSSWQQEGSKEGKNMAKKKKDVVQRSTNIVNLRDEVLQIQAAQSIDHGQAPEAIDRIVASTKPYTLTQRLAGFLPFSMKPRPPEPRPPSPKDKDVNSVLYSDILQTAAVPFTITTSNMLLLPFTVDNDLLQRQDVTMSIPQQLLTCDLQLTAFITTQQISNLDIRALSSWAEPELGSWLREPREKTELAALGRAFGRYWEVAKLRGKCWISCKQNFNDLVANAPESDSPLLYFGMQDIVFARSNVQLKVTWRISLSDHGEVESHSSAYPRFPATWQQEADSDLAKISDAFIMLVEDRGISEAVGMICKVVFPT